MLSISELVFGYAIYRILLGKCVKKVSTYSCISFSLEHDGRTHFWHVCYKQRLTHNSRV